MLAHLQGIIFDLDGTLVDSRLDFPAMRRETGCPEGEGLLEFLARVNDEHRRQEIARVIHAHEMRGAQRATWMPGADALLQQLVHSPLAVGILTRNSRAATRHTLAALNAPRMQDVVTREDARPKPDPDGLLQLAARWSLAPERLAYVGDFRFDMEAARAAGMVAVLYRPAGQASAPDWQADLEIGDFSQLAELLAQGPA